MGSPDGNGSSTGEGRNAALLLLRGGRRTGGNGTFERGSTLPSSNALRPDSNLNLGWYRPATPEDGSRALGERDESATHDEPARADERQPMVIAPATRLDLSANPASCDLDDFPLGARRSRDKAGHSEEGGARGSGWARVGLARLRRSAAVWLGAVAGEFRRRPSAMAVAAGLLVVVAFAAVIALDQPGRPYRGSQHIGSAVESSHLQGEFLSKVARSLSALSGTGSTSNMDGAAQHRAGSDAHPRSEIARAHGKQSNHPRAASISRSFGRSTPVSHAAAGGESNSQRTASAGSDSEATATAETPPQGTPSQQTPVQQTSTQQPVHYQPPAQPAGPTGLGSQVGGTCDPKCS
jgi:hypothetical protein